MTATEWQRASGVRNGQTFRKLRDELQQRSHVRKEGQRWQYVPNVQNVLNGFGINVHLQCT